MLDKLITGDGDKVIAYCIVIIDMVIRELHIEDKISIDLEEIINFLILITGMLSLLYLQEKLVLCNNFFLYFSKSCMMT